jgi:hypothetical protein
MFRWSGDLSSHGNGATEQRGSITIKNHGFTGRNHDHHVGAE